MYATLYKADGTIEEVAPKDGKSFFAEQLNELVGGTFQMITLPVDKTVFICHDEGAIIGLPANLKAFDVWKKNFPIDEYPDNNVDMVFGDILISDRHLVE